MTKRLAGLSALFAVALTACDSEQDLRAPQLPDTPGVASAFVDGTTGGNPFAFILPPLGNSSPSQYGDFDFDVEPTVELCLPGSGDTDCASILNDLQGAPGQWTVDGGPGGDIVVVNPVDQLYETSIQLGNFDLEPGELYRLRIRVDQNVLAAADLGVRAKGRRGNAFPSDAYVVNSAKRTIPLKFRLDDGALCWTASDPDVVECTSITLEAGQGETIALETSTGDLVVFELPDGWVGDVQNEGIVDDVTITIEEVETRFVDGESTCFEFYQLGDPDFGDPERCYDVRADTDTQTDVDVDFTVGALPVLAFCPDPDVLSAINGGNDNFLVTSVEFDGVNQVATVYPNVAPPASFPGCTSQVASTGPVGRMLAGAWNAVEPAVGRILPQPLHAAPRRADLGFGGRIARLSTIFFWSRFPESIGLAPQSITLTEGGATAQFTVDESFHHGPSPTPGNVVSVNWISTAPSVASVDAFGVVTPLAPGTAQIIATANNVRGFDAAYMADTANVVVEAAVNFSAVVTNILPSSTVAAGFGQTVVLEGTGFPPGARLFFEQNGVSGEAVTILTQPDFVWGRLEANDGTAPGLGAAELIVTDASGTQVAAAFDVTISDTPAAPTLIQVLDENNTPLVIFANTSGVPVPGAIRQTSGLRAPPASIAPGDVIQIEAEGLDFALAEILFTQGGTTTILSGELSQGGTLLTGKAYRVTVPALSDGDVTIRVRTTVNGVPSPPSNGLVLSVLNPGAGA